MELFIGNTYSRECLKCCKFPTWDLLRAFIFEEASINQNNRMIDANLLVGIVYDPAKNPNAPNHFCIYGQPNEDYDKIFGGVIASKKMIPVFHKGKTNEVIFNGCFEVVYLGRPRQNVKCLPERPDGRILVGEIELNISTKKC